jgi:hypothetical protein
MREVDSSVDSRSAHQLAAACDLDCGPQYGVLLVHLAGCGCCGSRTKSHTSVSNTRHYSCAGNVRADLYSFLLYTSVDATFVGMHMLGTTILPFE